jgi:hypothetical protein
MATTKPYPAELLPTTPGKTLAYNDFLQNCIKNKNGASSTYSITAAGTTQATAVQLNSVFNEVDTVASGTGVNLPNSAGKNNVPYQFCVIYNNGANALAVYAAQGTSDTINGTAGATGITMNAGSAALFASAQKGVWFSIGIAGNENFGNITATSISSSGNITESGLGFGFVQKAGTNGRAGTFTLNGATAVTVSNTTTAITDAIIISLNTVGGTVGVQPHVATITAGTGFTVVGTAGDTSVYNYSMIGTN